MEVVGGVDARHATTILALNQVVWDEKHRRRQVSFTQTSDGTSNSEEVSGCNVCDVHVNECDGMQLAAQL